MTMTFEILIDTERCKGCRLCAEACSRKLLTMSSSLNAAGLHFAEFASRNECTGCLHCAIMCPDAAIEMEQHENADYRQ